MLAQRHPERPGPKRIRLAQLINPEHSLCQLADAIDWSVFEREFGLHDAEQTGAPAKPTRLLVALHYLKYAFNHSDASVVDHLVRTPTGNTSAASPSSPHCIRRRW